MTKSEYKVDLKLLLPILLMAIISIITIYSAIQLTGDNIFLVYKQIAWYICGFILAYIIIYIGNKTIYKWAYILYLIGNISLLGLLIFADPINNAKCWYRIPFIGTIQPSEFMKIILIIIIGILISEFKNKYQKPTIKEEFLFLLKIITIVFIPSILTFLEPDTGVVIIYFIITLIMLFASGIRYRWFIFLFSIMSILLLSIFYIYYTDQDLFVKLFGTNFFLRIDRLLDWSNNSGYQLENSLLAIGSANIAGFGINNTPIYFPEATTDFVFAVYANNFGFLGSAFLLFVISYFDMKIILLAIKCKNKTNKYILIGIIGMLIYQQFQNIGMTIGLVPITGITLPFISYGGSSLLSYMLCLGIIFSISNNRIKYKNSVI